jgi:hypothetical protein
MRPHSCRSRHSGMADFDASETRTSPEIRVSTKYSPRIFSASTRLAVIYRWKVFLTFERQTGFRCGWNRDRSPSCLRRRKESSSSDCDVTRGGSSFPRSPFLVSLEAPGRWTGVDTARSHSSDTPDCKSHCTIPSPEAAPSHPTLYNQRVIGTGLNGPYNALPPQHEDWAADVHPRRFAMTLPNNR